MFHDVKCTSPDVKHTSPGAKYTFHDAKHKTPGAAGTFSARGRDFFCPRPETFSAPSGQRAIGAAGRARFNFREIVLYFVNLFCISAT